MKEELEIFREKFCAACGTEVTPENSVLFDDLGPILTLCVSCIKKYDKVTRKEAINTLRSILDGSN